MPNEDRDAAQPLGFGSSAGLGLLLEKLRSPWHHGDCKRAADEIERLSTELYLMTADRDSWRDQAAARVQDALDLVAEERERCAKAAEDFLTRGRSPLGRQVAAAIRGA